MADYPSMPVFTDAFLGDTTHLNTEEIGAYLLLLFIEWRRPDCDLPDDDAFLARTTRATLRHWQRALRPVLQPFFLVDHPVDKNGVADTSRKVWTQKRLQKEKRWVTDFRNRQRANAQHRWNDPKDLASATAKPPHMPKPSHSDAPIPIPKEDSLNGSGEENLSTGTAEPIVTAEKMASDLKALGLKPNGKHRSDRPAFDQNTSPNSPENNLALFQSWLAQRLNSQGQLGWQIVSLALNAFEPEHDKALEICKEATRTGGKGWPSNWPTNRSPAG